MVVVGPDTDSAPVGVRVVGDDDVGLTCAGFGQRQIHGSGLFGVWEADGREPGIGSNCAATVDGRSNPASPLLARRHRHRHRAALCTHDGQFARTGK